jgi:hypothetical protein
MFSVLDVRDSRLVFCSFQLGMVYFGYFWAAPFWELIGDYGAVTGFFRDAYSLLIPPYFLFRITTAQLLELPFCRCFFVFVCTFQVIFD